MKIVAVKRPFHYINISAFVGTLARNRLVIAIDGPAASGKSTTARLVAERMGYIYVDTGAMYRAVTLEVLRRGIDPGDVGAVGGIAASARIDLKSGKQGLRVFLNGEDVSTEIRAPEVTRHVSAVSRVRGVRQALVKLQRQAGSQGGVVLEGRDIGTVVFPRADVKIFMVADLSQRSERRRKELRAQGVEVSREALMHDLSTRDELDAGREESPLVKAEDAIELDTSELTITEQVDFVVRKAEEILRKMNME